MKYFCFRLGTHLGESLNKQISMTAYHACSHLSDLPNQAKSPVPQNAAEGFLRQIPCVFLPLPISSGINPTQIWTFGLCKIEADWLHYLSRATLNSVVSVKAQEIHVIIQNKVIHQTVLFSGRRFLEHVLKNMMKKLQYVLSVEYVIVSGHSLAFALSLVLIVVSLQSSITNSDIIFVKVHAPWEVLGRYAELMNVRMPFR